MQLHKLRGFLVFSAWLAAACGSDTSDERAKAADLGQGCSINSDCKNPYVCAFSRCHVECEDTARDCEAPSRCVKWEGVGVCQLDDEITCGESKPCPGKQVCSAGFCRDYCTDMSECLSTQSCVQSVCEDTGSGGSAGQSSGGAAGGGAGGVGAGGAGGASGGTSQTGGNSGVGGNSGSAGQATGGTGGQATGGTAGQATGGTAGQATGGTAGQATGGTAGQATGGTAGTGGGGATLPAPVAYWPFDDVGGGAADSYGDLLGTIKGDAQSVAGRVGKALEFNISTLTQNVTVNYRPEINAATALTISAWINPSTFLNSSAGSRTFMHLQTTTTLQYVGGSLRFVVYSGAGAPTNLDHAVDLSPGGWHHLVGTYDVAAGNQMELYLDGTRVAFQAGPGSIGATNQPLYIGSNVAYQQPFVGKMDEVSFYKRGLSQAEVSAAYSAGMAGQALPDCSACVSPSFHWKFDDSVDTTVPDAVAAHSGTNVDGAASVPGRVGTALKFVHSADQVVVPHAAALTPPNALSVTLWIRPSVTIQVTDPEHTGLIEKWNYPDGYQIIAGGTYAPRANIGPAVHGISQSFLADTWYHVALVWDGQAIQLYVNASSSTAPTAQTGPLGSAAVPLYLGGSGILGKQYQGLMDEVALYDVALTPDQVAASLARGAAGQPVWP
ncbi:MAG: LamG domain-containing protein [Polyangiaceae bacterium]|nr:LamG domain-containing protein [Myxococcales bacterium]MCB9587099.1 LamG domain-containing protein [Polyangiaceae bacterium]MCB9609526.1 LamG domain-containing protein [Polyangiaceae bacterium]